MYRSKGMKVDWNDKLVSAYILAGALLVSAACKEDEILVFHAYIYDNKQARFLYSASCFRDDENEKRNLIGRSNKRLQWEDIQYFQKQGLEKYDWGGIANPEHPNGIDKFKMAFGDEVFVYNNYIVGMSLKGKLAIFAMNLLKR